MTERTMPELQIRYGENAEYVSSTDYDKLHTYAESTKAALEQALERVKELDELLWNLYEKLYGHRNAENIDFASTAVRGAIEVNKAWNDRGRNSEQRAADLARQLETVAAERDALAKGWQPIETAPKDGTWILLGGGHPDDDDSIPRPAVAQWTHDLNSGKTDWHWQFAWYDGGYYGYYENPTHWKPLPPPPAIDGAMK